jgi:hypothetical protein
MNPMYSPNPPQVIGDLGDGYTFLVSEGDDFMVWGKGLNVWLYGRMSNICLESIFRSVSPGNRTQWCGDL